MEINSKKDNILIESRIRGMLKKRGLKTSKKAINELDTEIKKIIKQIIEASHYNLEIKGKKVIKTKDIQEALKKIKKEEEFYEI